MAQYMCLIYDEEAKWSGMNDSAQLEMIQAYHAFTEEVKAAGALVSGDALQPTATATTIRNRDGKLLTTDGPFAETKEQLGGYYLLECKDLDEALAWAAKIPSVKVGSVEVRPLMVYPDAE